MFEDYTPNYLILLSLFVIVNFWQLAIISLWSKCNLSPTISIHIYNPSIPGIFVLHSSSIA